jgi:hypothetical protein
MPPKIFPVVGFPWKRRTGINFIMRSTSVLYQKKRTDFSTSNLRMRAMFTLTTLKQSSSHSSGAGTAPVVAEEAVVVGKRSHESEIGLPPFPEEIQVLRDECG